MNMRTVALWQDHTLQASWHRQASYACRGAKVVVAGSAFGEMAMHFIEKYGMMALRLPSKFDMRRFCR